jgi:hypothetical protein
MKERIRRKKSGWKQSGWRMVIAGEWQSLENGRRWRMAGSGESVSQIRQILSLPQAKPILDRSHSSPSSHCHKRQSSQISSQATDTFSSDRILPIPDGCYLFRTDSVHSGRMQDIRRRFAGVYSYAVLPQ